MTTETLFSHSIPRDYDRFLGPFLFEDYAADLARRARLEGARDVLETTCGTGISTEALARGADREARIVATDLSEPMLEVAREKCGGHAGVRFQAADAAALPFEDGSFDRVVSQFGLMFFEDKLAALREARRVLRPGGRLVLSVWDAPAKNPYVEVAQRTIATFFREDPPGFLDVPWGLHDRDVLRQLFVDAGFAEPAIETVSREAELPRARDAAEGLVRGNPTLKDVETRAEAPVADVVDAVAAALGRVFGHAPFRVPMRAVVVSAER